MSHHLKIALVSLYVFENNGVRFLAAALREQGFEVHEIYFKDYVHHHHVPPSQKELDVFIGLLKQIQPGLIGVSLRAGAYFKVAAQVTNEVRKHFDVPIMLGGPHVSMASDSCLELADFLVVGEAEQAVVEIAETIEKGQDVSAIENVWLKDEKGIIKNPLRPLCQDLDSIPFRDFHSNDFKHYMRDAKVFAGEPLVDERLFLMLTSRGCAYNCAFCDVSAFRKIYKGTAGKFFRYRSVENCMAELEYARGIFKKLRKIRFDDELFVPDHDWIQEFADVYPKRIGLPFEILSDPRCLDDWSIETLKGAGMDAVLVGIQGCESANRRLYNRPAPDQRVIDMANALKRNKVHGVFQVIVDDPETLPEEKESLLNVLLALPKPYDLITFSLCHWPSSDRTDDLLEKGLIQPEDVEGQTNKVLSQFLADYSFQRSVEDTYYLALYELANKVLIPRSWVRKWAKSEKLKKNPAPLTLIARIANLGKLFTTGMGMLFKGQISLNTIRRWFHVFSSPSF